MAFAIFRGNLGSDQNRRHCANLIEADWRNPRNQYSGRERVGRAQRTLGIQLEYPRHRTSRTRFSKALNAESRKVCAVESARCRSSDMHHR